MQNGVVCAVSAMPVSQALPQTWYDPTGPAEPDRAAATWHTLALHAVTAPNWGYAGRAEHVGGRGGPNASNYISVYSLGSDQRKAHTLNSLTNWAREGGQSKKTCLQPDTVPGYTCVTTVTQQNFARAQRPLPRPTP